MLVRVPASSANLGPGFDCFGIAWKLYNEIDFSPSDTLIIRGCEERFANENNLAFRSFSLSLAKRGIFNKNVKIDFVKTEIPVSRGLGSSSALIVGGVLAANEMYALNFSEKELLDVANEIEGHPDNVAPALFGGLTASTILEGGPVTVHFPLSEKLHFAALVPPTELSTALARSVIPSSFSKEAALFNISHASLLLNALGSGDVRLLSQAMQDKIHQPYRLPLIENAEIAGRLSRECGGKALCISGAGSTLLAVSDEPSFAKALDERIWLLDRWRAIPLEPDFQGAQII